MLAAPGAVVLVASGGDPALVDLGSLPSRPFPQRSDGEWAGSLKTTKTDYSYHGAGGGFCRPGPPDSGRKPP